MKALTLRHPWPWAIANGKPVENRKWEPPASLLRPGDWLAFHGGKSPAGMALAEAATDYQWIIDRGLLKPAGGLLSQLISPYASAIFAVVHYTGVVTKHDSRWFFGPFGWCWDKIIILPTPVPCRGAQKLWDVPADVLDKMRAQFRKSDGR